jgi:hypothetical protein
VVTLLIARHLAKAVSPATTADAPSHRAANFASSQDRAAVREGRRTTTGQLAHAAFFVRKTKSPFLLNSLALPKATRHRAKVFASFFKKKCFLASTPTA